MNQNDIKHADSLMRTGDDQSRDRAGPSGTQGTGGLVQRRASCHHVIDQEHGAPGDAGAGLEGALKIGPAGVSVQTRLFGRVAGSAQQPGL
jgi:hypothetical protein